MPGHVKTIGALWDNLLSVHYIGSDSRARRGGFIMSDESRRNNDTKKHHLFLSYSFRDEQAAEVLAHRLQDCSADLQLSVAGNSKFQNPNVGQSLPEGLCQKLHESQVVLMLFSSDDKGWSQCTWEVGVATDPLEYRNTKAVILSLYGDSPPILPNHLFVNATDIESVRSFMKQFCLEPGFFPGLQQLTPGRREEWTREKADMLFEQLGQFTQKERRKDTPRWPGLRIKLSKEYMDHFETKMRADDPPRGEELREIMGQAVVIECDPIAMQQFDYTNETGVTLLDLRKRWLQRRLQVGRDVAKNVPWDEIIGAEIWRICCNRRPELTWDPFLGLRGEVWLFPVITRSWINPDSSREFQILLLETMAPGNIVPG